ncbi:MAG TPA: alpha-galactosidase [Anaerolineaceae bacterium]
MDTGPRYWILETDRSAYTFGINAQGLLVHAYWGQRRPAGDYPLPAESTGWASFNGPAQILPEEYPAYGGMGFHEPCLKATFVDGVRDVLLEFVSGASVENGVDIHLRDAHYPLLVTLRYRVHPRYDLIERWAEITNPGSQPVLLERVFSAQWHVPAGRSYHLSHLTGRWNDEFHLVREPLTTGVKVLESRRITSSHHHNPWFRLDDGSATETAGEVWFGGLQWSGNWKLAAEVTNFETTRTSLGINDWDFAWKLSPGETFITPAAIAGYTPDGFGAASRILHDFIRAELLPHGQVLHKVLYNSWEATLFAVDEQSQARLAEMSAEMGVELFVVDDGWFHRRNHDAAGLGDWRPDQSKFPDGLGPLIHTVNRLGMDFGLWIEPEMVNPDSDLYRAHPDWILHYPTRVPTLARNQMILNLARADVQEYLIETIDRLLVENNISFIKWDMNRNASEPGWPGAPGDPREVWVRYVQGLYRVWGELRRRHPSVVWQSCSGGGGRADLGILRYADQVWPSDNTHALARLQIQHGFSQAYPANIMEAWVTDAGREQIPLAFRFHVSMCGCLGIGGNLPSWSAGERSEAAHWIARYKDLRGVIQQGDQYRVAENAIQYLSKDRSRGVLIAFGRPGAPVEVRLRGLEPDWLYSIEGFESQKSGAEWMVGGAALPLANLESTLREIIALTGR